MAGSSVVTRHCMANPVPHCGLAPAPISAATGSAALLDQDLALDDVEPGHLLGDGVLDLDAVDLDEVELAGRCRRGTRPCRRYPAARPADRPRGLAEDAARRLRIEVRRRCDLHHLLMAALPSNRARKGAPGRAGRRGAALRCGEPRLTNFRERRPGRRKPCLPRGALGRGRRRVARPWATPMAAAAAHGGLDDDGVAQLVGDATWASSAVPRRCRRGDGDVGRFAAMPRRATVCRWLFVRTSGARADEGDARTVAGVGEGGVLGEEAVAGVEASISASSAGRRSPSGSRSARPARPACRCDRPRRP